MQRQKDREIDIERDREIETERERETEGESFLKLGMMVNAGEAETRRSLKLAGQVVLPNG